MNPNERSDDTIAEISNSDGLAFHKDQSSGVVNGIPMQMIKTITDSKSEGQLINIPIKYLSEGENVRKKIEDDEEFKGLVESIKESGLIQYPTIAYQKGKICIISGHRRVAAVRALKWEKIRCVIKIIGTDSDRLHIQLAENINRSNLKPVDYAEAILRFKEEADVSNERIGELFGKSRKYIEQLVKIGGWSDEVKDLIEKHNLDITPLIKIAFKKEAKDPHFVLQEVQKLIPSEGRDRTKSDEGISRSVILAEKKRAKIQEWIENKGYSQNELSLILTFLQDMRIKGWYSDIEMVND